MIQETWFSGTSLALPKSSAKGSASGSSRRSSRDLDDSTENTQDRGTLASFGSENLPHLVNPSSNPSVATKQDNLDRNRDPGEE